MKVTLLSDIHGNLPALEAVIRHAEGQMATQIILNLGDSVGYGPNPNEVVLWTQSERVINILGNYDKKVLSKKHRKKAWSGVKNPDKRAMFAWTYQALSKKSRRILKSMPEQRELTLEGHKILMTHGSPASINEHLLPDTSENRLKELAAMNKADIILCGHSHQAFVRRVGDVQFINPGTVGRPDDGDPRASYAILDFSEEGLEIEFFRVPYNISSAVQTIRETGLPENFAQVIRRGRSYDGVMAEISGTNPTPKLIPSGTLTLLTDFGTRDHFTGVMKGVILYIAPQAQIVDISHHIDPQNVRQGALMLSEAVPYFAPGTVHVAIVDPGVGTKRRALAARIGQQYYVAPDNGLLSFVLQQAQEQQEQIQLFALDQPQYWLPQISQSFHGRDIFSPIGAHLVNGISLETLGSPINDPMIIETQLPIRTETGWIGEVISIDTFGNLSSNVTAQDLLQEDTSLEFFIQGETIHGITHAFADAQPGTLIATIDSSGALAISVVNGSAKEQLQAKVGTQIQIQFLES